MAYRNASRVWGGPSSALLIHKGTRRGVSCLVAWESIRGPSDPALDRSHWHLTTTVWTGRPCSNNSSSATEYGVWRAWKRFYGSPIIGRPKRRAGHESNH